MAGVKEIIDKVVKGDLCTGCGTCAGICPNSAIEMAIHERKGIYVPELDETKCNQCGICLDICPGRFGNLDKLNLELFGKELEDILLGNYISCYLAHAADYGIRYNSASGGLVTSLLIFALEQRIIDGALVTKMSEENPLRPDVFIARSKEEIICASKSKYCPVPANVALKEVFKEDGKFAVVGLPCHIHGIRKAELADNKLKEKIALHLGIFCSHTNSFKGTEFLLHKLGLKEEKVAEISYRGGGWPGGIKIKLVSGGERSISNQAPLWNNIFSSFFFTPSRCLLCQDLTNELADISFGDAWLPEIMATEHEGKSVVISRSQHGEALLREASSEGEIEISLLDVKDVVRSQKRFLHFKKVNLEARIWLWKLFGGESPYAGHETKTSLYNRVVALLPLINSYLGQRVGFMPLLKHIPIRMLGIYTSAFYRLYSRAIKDDFGKLLSGEKRLNILILHAHWNNRGDEAAVRAMIDSLKSELPVKKMSIMIISRNVTQFPYDEIEIVDWYPSSIRTYLDTLLVLITFGKLSLTKKGRKFIKAVDEADVVIHAPGGPSVGDLYGGRLLADFPYICRLLISRLFKNKPLFFYACSIGPFSGRFRNFIRRLILKRADAIILREEISATYLRERLGLDSYVTTDSALQNDIPEDYISRYTNISEILKIIQKEKVIGIVITDLKWHGVYKKYSGLAKKIIGSFSDVAQYLINKGYVILLIPQLFGEAEDASLLERIYQLNKEKMFILPSEVDSYAQQIIVSKLFCLISMRYHPSVLAAKGSTPFICASYEHKMNGFMERIGLTHLMVNVEKISTNELIDKFTYLEENYDAIKKQLNRLAPQLKEEARKTTRIMLEKLDWQMTKKRNVS